MGAGEPSRVARALAAITPEVRVARALRPLTDRFQNVPVAPRGSTLLGISFRPHQARAFGLDVDEALRALLAYPFQLIRLAAYWNEIEPEPGVFHPDALDRQVEAAERAGKHILLNVGAVKAFGYPEFYAPASYLTTPLREGLLIDPATYGALLSAAGAFITRVIERYKGRAAIVAWQVEQEAVDPLGVEHSWRLAEAFVQREVDATRAADPTRPVMMNGFLPASLPVRAQQWWRTRDQGDSLAVARRMADIVGIDYYPRHALAGAKSWAIYLNGGSGGGAAHAGARQRLFAWARSGGRLMISEGQAEPWEAITTPPNPRAWGMYTCLPEHVIENYNQWMAWTREGACDLYAYLFWGAEYWLLRERSGDPRYLQAFARILAEA